MTPPARLLAGLLAGLWLPGFAAAGELALIIDDLGLRPLADDEPVDLYELIRRRYERGSLIITSNRAIDEWYGMFGDPLLASSAMDRLLHHSHVVTLEGDSYRNPPSSRQPKTA